MVPLSRSGNGTFPDLTAKYQLTHAPGHARTPRSCGRLALVGEWTVAGAAIRVSLILSDVGLQ